MLPKCHQYERVFVRQACIGPCKRILALPEESNLVAYESVKRNHKAVFGLRDSRNSKKPS
jgi:hypothetical protein